MPAPLPDVSVALATRNGAEFLPALLDSLRAQTHRPAELIVCDDGSTDATRPILADFARGAPFPVTVRGNQSPLGPVRNFARAVGLCRAPLICMADQDDVWLPGKIERLAQALADRPEAGAAICDATVVDDRLQPLGYSLWDTLPFPPAQRRRFAVDPLAVLLRYNVAAGITLMFRAAVRDLALPFPAEWMHDGWVILMAAATGPCAVVAEELVDYRQHGGQQVGGRRLRFADQVRRARAMDASYFCRLAGNFTAAEQRLHERGLDGYRDAPHRFREKAVHAAARAALRRGEASHLSVVCREWFSGRYHRDALGWKSALQDLILA